MSSPALSTLPASIGLTTSSNPSTLSTSPILNQDKEDAFSKSARFILDYQAALGSIAKKYNSPLVSLIFRPFSFTFENKERHPHEGISELSKPGALLKTLKVAAEKLRIELGKKDLDSDDKNILSEEFSSTQNLTLKQVDTGFSIQQINIEGNLKAGIFDANKRLCYGLIYYHPDGETCEGTFYKNGKIQEGTAVFPFLKTCEGTFSENGELLKGKIIFPDGTIYDENRRLLKFTLPDGRTHEGTFDENGKLREGKKTFPNGEIHEGTFDENEKLRKGKWTFPNESICEGTFDENGKLQEGKKTSYLGTFTEEGTFDENEKLREGKMTFLNEEIHEGTFDENGKLRKGKRTFPNESIYEGTFAENGKLQEGKKIFFGGIFTEEGTFYENGKLREGKWTFLNGETQEGTFYENGKLKEGKWTLPNGEIREGTFNQFGQLLNEEIAETTRRLNREMARLKKFEKKKEGCCVLQ